MKRSRSALARHRKQKLLEATQHVSAAPELRLVGELAAAVEPVGLLNDVVSDWDHHHGSQSGDTVACVVSALRNVSNSVYHRAMAARALGLLMRRDAALVARLRLESEELLDALLQLINCCRRFKIHNNDTRRVHVNCCLVISLLTRAPHSKPQQLVVSLESELLAMPPRPVESSSGFLLLTVTGRPESSSSDSLYNGTGLTLLPPSATKDRAPLRPLRAVPAPPQYQTATEPMAQTDLSNERRKATPKPPVISVEADEVQRLAPVIDRRQTPSREFKMDRFRVVTPAMVPSSVQGPRTPLPVIPPGTNQQPSPRSLDAPPPASASLVSSQNMVEILRTGKMPVAASDYFRDRLRDDSPATEPPVNRLPVVEWGEWRRRGLTTEDTPSSRDATPLAPPPLTSQGHHTPQPHADIHTPEYKRQRLREILASPADASPESTAQLLALDSRTSSATLTALAAERAQLQAAEHASRLALRTRIDAQRDRLPLKFLFTLPGGAAYCRDRMRRAVALWLREFEANQQRLALLQWKSVVEQLRYRDRGQAYHRLALERRLRAAIAFVLRSYQRQALDAWVASTQTRVWLARDAAARRLQRQARRRRGLLTLLRRHDAFPFGGPFLRDVYLAPSRGDSVAFALPARVRDHRRRLWRAALTVQHKLRYRRFRRFVRRYRVAATRIQARARMRIARRRYRLDRRRVVTLQAWVRGHAAYVAYQALRSAARLVQTAFRGVRVRRLRRLVRQAQHRASEWRLTAALRLQRVARAWLARRSAQRHAAEAAARWLAALVVQRAWYRRNNEWSTFLLLGCLREQEREERAVDRAVASLTRRGRARQIQRAYAAHRTARRSLAALVVQRGVRRWLATRVVARKRRRLMAHRRIKWFWRCRHAHRIATASRLQFAWLRAVPGRLARHLRSRRLAQLALHRQQDYHRIHAGAVAMQRLARGHAGRAIARQERSARVIQRRVRGFLLWRRLQRELRRAKALVAQRTASEYVAAALRRVVALRVQVLCAAATVIQRRARGVGTRARLTRSLVAAERRDAMARRLQRRWRQSAQLRVAQRVLEAQRRRRENPFSHCGSVSAVVHAAVARATALFDPADELQGVHVAAWLRRLGLREDAYLAVLGSVDLPPLRRLSHDACREALEALGVDDDEHARHMATHLLARRTLEDAQRRRRELAALQHAQRRDEAVRSAAAAALARAEALQAEAATLLERAMDEAREFRHAPKAVRDLQAAQAQRLAAAQAGVAQAATQLSLAAQRVAQRQQTMARRRVELAEVEKREVSASYSVASFRLLTGRPHVARELFLGAFPGLEARALAFAAAVGERASTWQLVRFLGEHATVAAVKQAMPLLTHSAHEAAVARHDHARLGQCCDVVQFACERVGELLGLSVEALVLGGGGGGGGDKAALLPCMVVDALAARGPVKDRAVAWLAWAETLRRMDAVATRVQSHWRRRAAVRVAAALHAARWQQRVKAAYVAEVTADYVTPLWRQEREREREELLAWEEEEALRVREELLQRTLRHPWREAWDDDAQQFSVGRPDAVLGWAWLSEFEPRPVYAVEEEDAAIVVQTAARRWLARSELRRRQRQQRRQRKRRVLEERWRSGERERAQAVTLRLALRVAADADVRVWLGRRGGHAPAPPPDAKRRRAAVDRPADERQRVADVASVAAVDARVAAAIGQDAYHASVRAVHRRHAAFPVTARPPNVHAQAVLAVLAAAQRLHCSLAPRVATSTALPFTRASLPFGWRAEGDFFYHEATGEASWERPVYAFDHDHAATVVQSVVRMALARATRRREADALSLVPAAREAVELAARIGWIGVGLEGLTPRVLLAWLGLPRATIDATPLTIDALLRPPPEAKLLQLGWTREEAGVLAASAALLRPVRRKPPLSSHVLPLASVGSGRHALHAVPSERALQQLVAQSLPNQQGRVAALVHAVRQSTTPVTVRQLEMHLRRFAGRPDEAAARVHEIASLPFATQPPQEQQVLDELLRGLERCLVAAAVHRLRALHAELSTVARVAAALLAADEARLLRSPATPLAPRPPPGVLAAAVEEARAWCLASSSSSSSSPKGLWEPGTLSPVHVARFVRLRGLERALQWWRSAALVQSLVRMRRARAWLRLTLAWRRACALQLQRVWRGCLARELRRLLEQQRRSPFETRRDALTQTFYVVHAPTGEKLAEEPRDAAGALLPVRPMVQDRATRRWLRAWPHDGQQQQQTQQVTEDSEAWAVACSVCKVERGVRRCLACVAPSGDYVDLCLPCFVDRHAESESPHPFTVLHAGAAARTAFHCVECQRFATQRCLACDEHYCARCFARVHRRGHRRASHRCEHYAARAAVCAECERRVAVRRCAQCGDALCAACAAAIHARGAKRGHSLALLAQPLAAGEAHCEQCQARRGDAGACGFCQATLCAVCLADERAHAAQCVETRLALAVRALAGERRCVECGRQADRRCARCGDLYCSVRWMGHAGCFEKFHWKGRRADHVCEPLPQREDGEGEGRKEREEQVRLLEEQVRAKRREDAVRAEHEASELAAALRLAAEQQQQQPEAKKQNGKKSKARKKRRASAAGGCRVDACAAPTLSAAVPYCARHLTSQHALEVARQDPLEAAKLMATVEQHGGALPAASPGLWARWRGRKPGKQQKQ